MLIIMTSLVIATLNITGVFFLPCKSRCFKTANIKILFANSTHTSYTSHLFSQRIVINVKLASVLRVYG